jgi:hypothetical protein
MIDKDYLDSCKVSSTESSKSTIILAIHNYINMHPQLLPRKEVSRDTILYETLIDNKLQLLKEEYFTSNNLNYAWGKAFLIVYDTEKKTKTILIKNGEKYSRISSKFSISTLRRAYKLIVKDLYYQFFFLKCKKNLDFFIDKMKKTSFFIKEKDRYIKTTNIIYRPGANSVNYSFVHQYVIVRYSSLSKEWSYEHGQKVLYGLAPIVGYIKQYMQNISNYDKFTNEDIVSIMEEQINKNVSDMRKNIENVVNSF